MDFLKNYNFSDEQINNLKQIYDNEIISFIENNEDYVEEKLIYLKKENFALLYEILYNNIKIVLESIYVLKDKIDIMKNNNISLKAMNMVLIDEYLYDKV